jgi:hypothetical protein
VSIDLLQDGLLDLAGPPTVPEGTCHVCRSRPGRLACRACDRATCADDLWTMFALCRSCVPDDQMQRWHVRGEIDPENWLAGAKAP